MFVGEKHTIEPLRGEIASLEPDDDLPRTQATIDQDPAMIGRNEGAVAGAAATEHGEAEHEESLAKRNRIHKRNCRDEKFFAMLCWSRRQRYCTPNLLNAVCHNVRSCSAAAIHQRKHMRFFGSVIEGAEFSDFLETAHAIERVKKVRITGSQLARLQITAA